MVHCTITDSCLLLHHPANTGFWSPPSHNVYDYSGNVLLRCQCCLGLASAQYLPIQQAFCSAMPMDARIARDNCKLLFGKWTNLIFTPAKVHGDQFSLQQKSTMTHSMAKGVSQNCAQLMIPHDDSYHSNNGLAHNSLLRHKFMLSHGINRVA